MFYLNHLVILRHVFVFVPVILTASCALYVGRLTPVLHRSFYLWAIRASLHTAAFQSVVSCRGQFVGLTRSVPDGVHFYSA